MAIKLLSSTLFVAITLVSFNINAYTMLADRFDVNGTVIDDFDDGVAGGWSNFNGIDTFGTWQDEAGTSFARLESPGLVQPSLFGLNATTERSSIFSISVPGGTVVGGSAFNALLTLDTILPALDQIYFFGLSNFDDAAIANSTLTDTVVFGLTNVSADFAALSGVTQGLNFGQFRIEYGPNLAITNVTDVSYISLSMPSSFDTIQLAMQYDEIGGVGQLAGSYRFDSNGGFISPLSAINTNVVNGFWDIGTSETTVVPVPAAVWLFGSGLVGLIGIARRKKT